jgi:NADPH-dependent glutamate synthase beta subunit-like oxidoreductase/NAD(P)H-flavin reductase
MQQLRAEDVVSQSRGDSQHSAAGGALIEECSLALGLPGFTYADLHQPSRLADLTREFDRYLEASDAALHAAFSTYRTSPDALGPVERSRLLVRVASQLSRFVAMLFGVETECQRQRDTARSEEVVFAFKRDFLQRRAFKKYPGTKSPSAPFSELDRKAVSILRGAAAGADPELQTARAVMDLLASRDRVAADAANDSAAAEELGRLEADIALLEEWSAARRHDPEGHAAIATWVSYKEPENLDPLNLVEVEHSVPELPEAVRGPEERMRRRDGFVLTDRRMAPRQVLDEAHYCVLCHDRDKDSCSKGLTAKEGGFKKNPLGISLAGCPLDEKISEAHALRRDGDALGALAVVCIDNPMCPGTGHRICNDCMKSCIFQKQEPVNIPQIETGLLTDVLKLPYGFEIWDLLTRWNPLNVRRPHALPYNGKNVLVVGLGPAGYTLAHYLLNEGFGVIGIDGLKIEPLPVELTGDFGQPPRPIRDLSEISCELDERPLAGFGGVSEYGITVRWDKNFLTMIHLCLARRRAARFYGGVRFGGTMSVDEAWETGFDHVAIAAGAGRPTIIEMKNNVSRGIRKASDFLMALQLTGAFKRRALANLEVRLPAIIVGGGLTAIDSATELMAYYPVQVEKTLFRFETLAAEIGEERLWAAYSPEEKERLRIYLDHGRAIRAERERAAAAGEDPDFAPLIESWGGVAIAYRKRMSDSPAYRLNHEEIIKALEEGIRFIECVDPEEARVDEHGALREVSFKRLRQEADGRWAESPDRLALSARTLLVAAGTSPNVTYEKEQPGTFEMDERRQFFRAHRAERGPDGAFRPVPVDGRGAVGFFTSYSRNGRMVSYFGDNHPRYAGNVVKAMASAKDGYPHIVELFAGAIGALTESGQPERDAALRALQRHLDDQLNARVVAVNRLTPTIVEAVVRAPMAARAFRPGQFYRLQNFEASAAQRGGQPLLIEPLALTGAWVDRERGLLGLIALELGVSSRLLGHLRAGEEVIVMGPTGAPTEITPHSNVLLAGGGLGNAVLFSIAKEAKERGCRVIYFAGYKKGEDLFKREEIEAATDVVVWSVDSGTPIPAGRPQDSSFVGNIVQAMVSYAKGELGAQPVRLQEVDRIIAIGSDRMMAAVAWARHDALRPYLREDHVGIGSINSPMQCMMKEVCAQCLQKHVDPKTGRETIVFSCFNQDQLLDHVDWAHLRQRLAQNTVQEKLSGLWLEHLLRLPPSAAAR